MRDPQAMSAPPGTPPASGVAGDRSTVAAEWRAHWPMVLAAFVGISVPIVPYFTLGLFFEPLSAEFGWSRTLISAGGSIAAAVAIPLSPFIGALIDRWGVRYLALAGLVLTTVTLACFSLASGSHAQWLAFWATFAVVGLMLKTTIWTAAINHAFDAGRSMALAVTMAGITFCHIIAPPIAQWLVDGYGWRDAYLFLAIGWGIPAFTLSLLFLRDVRGGGGGHRSHHDGGDKASSDLPGLTIHQALRSVALWRVGIATFLTLLFSSTLTIHKVPLLTEAGVARETAAWLTSLSGVAGFAGLMMTGWLMDRFKAGLIGGITNGAMALSLVMLLEPFRTPTLIVISMVVAGYAGGTKLQINAFLTVRYAGMRNYGKIYGVMASLIACTGVLGPVFGGLMYDLTGNYTLLILAAIPASAMAGLLLIGLGPYPQWSPSPNDDASIPDPGLKEGRVRR